MLSTIWQLIWRFFTTGLLAVGGGLATLPFIYEMGAATGWFTEADVLNMIAVSEATPGPIGVNMATYVGYTVIDGLNPEVVGSGWFGGIITTLSVVAPSIIIAILVSRVLEKFKGSPLVEGVFSTLRPASTALIGAAALSVMSSVLFNIGESFALASLFTLSTYNILAIVFAAAIFFANKYLKGHPIIYIAIGAVLGIVFKL